MKFTEEKENKNQGYDLNLESDKAVIKEFEAMLESLKHEPLVKPLDFYGEPKVVIPAFEMGSHKFPESKNPRRVYNDILGLTDAGVAQYLLRIRAISRRYVTADHPGRSWAVGPDLKAYEDFYQKKHALDELKNKRAYAKELEAESLDALAKSRETLIKSMKT